LKTIDTLIPDIKELLVGGLGEQYVDEGIGERMYDVLRRGLQPRDPDRGTKVWFSNVGSPCVRQLWYKVHCGNEAEPLRANTRLKFLYGDFLEEIILELARIAGHVVEHEQARLEWRDITGRIDAVIDGHLLDVKTASKFSFAKFKGGLKPKDDSFGYLGQLKGYLLAARANGLVAPDCNTASFLVIAKETGDIHLDTHTFTKEELQEFEWKAEVVKVFVADNDNLPERGFEDNYDGKSGNKRLAVNCSYCSFKHKCWPGLRTFLYANGPTFLTKVVRTPLVPEIKGVYYEPD
jgi:hypothetical protein